MIYIAIPIGNGPYLVYVYVLPWYVNVYHYLKNDLKQALRCNGDTTNMVHMQALVRVQAHMLARIVVEIRAADIAVEFQPQLVNCSIP